MISILMPVKNAAPYLEECLESIQQQTHANWELIAIDDQSDDNSIEILNQYAKLDSRIHWEKNKDKGIIPALRQAFSFSKGQFISRMDADDKMPKDKLEQFLLMMDEKVVVSGKVQYFSEGEVSEGYKRYEQWLNGLQDLDHWKHIYRECTVASPNWMVHRQFFETEFEWEKWKYPEDYDMLFHWCKAGYFIKKCPSITHFWREHPQRTSRNNDRYQQASFFDLKTNWFVDLEIDKTEEIQLIGSGIKAKRVEEVFKKREILFTSYAFKEKSGYQSIYDLNPAKKAILTNWPVDEHTQNEIQLFLEARGFEFGNNLWLF